MIDADVVIPADADERTPGALEQRYRELFEGALLAIYVSRPDGTLVACNAAFARMLGFATTDEALRARMSAMYEEPRDREHFVASVRQHGRLEHHRARLRRRDGGVVDVVETVVGEFDGDGVLVELRGFLIDVSASGDVELALAERERQFRVEERLIESEKIESVGRLAGGIAHDFNNLLTAILGYTELLLGARGACDPDRADLEEIQRAAQRAATLTQQLLAFSRKQVLMPKDVDLNGTVGQLQAMLARLIREDITLSCRLAPEPALIRIDPAQLEQAILNLVLNARDALPAGGQITLDVAHVQRSQREMPPDQPGTGGEYVRLRVVDNGVGIAPEARAHLFEPFFTTKAIGKGTGLGLASVYGIVRQSNGFLTVESEPGAGSTFTMHFPAVLRSSDPAVALPAAVDMASRGETILLVEDDDAVRAIIGAVLRRHGYRVLDASGPLRACEIVEAHADIDLLLTDVVMPVMNGPALAQRLIGARPQLRVLFISGYADALAPLDPANPHVSFLSKPFRASVLIGRVRAMLARRGEPADVPR